MRFRSRYFKQRLRTDDRFTLQLLAVKASNLCSDAGVRRIDIGGLGRWHVDAARNFLLTDRLWVRHNRLRKFEFLRC